MTGERPADGVRDRRQPLDHRVASCVLQRPRVVRLCNSRSASSRTTMPPPMMWEADHTKAVN